MPHLKNSSESKLQYEECYRKKNAQQCEFETGLYKNKASNIYSQPDGACMLRCIGNALFISVLWMFRETFWAIVQHFYAVDIFIFRGLV